MAQKAVFVNISLFDELKNIVVADVDVQVLVEDALYLIDANQSPLFAVKQSEHVQSFLFPSSTEEPFFSDQIYDLAEWEAILVLVGSSDFVLDLLPVHFSIGEVAENTS